LQLKIVAAGPCHWVVEQVVMLHYQTNAFVAGPQAMGKPAASPATPPPAVAAAGDSDSDGDWGRGGKGSKGKGSKGKGGKRKGGGKGTPASAPKQAPGSGGGTGGSSKGNKGNKADDARSAAAAALSVSALAAKIQDWQPAMQDAGATEVCRHSGSMRD
jgi:hypothetical protein